MIRFGWRIWAVKNGRLFSPFIDTFVRPVDELPPNGLIVADQRPAEDNKNGIYFWPYLTDMYSAIRTFKAAGSRLYAITFGEVTGPLLPDTTFNVGGRPLFYGLRGSAYRVLVAITVAALAAHDFPVIAYTDRLPDLNAIAKEYAA